MSSDTNHQDLEDEISHLEAKLKEARSKLKEKEHHKDGDEAGVPATLGYTDQAPLIPHALLLLSDSALPLGSFAFSSGLESYLAHKRHFPPSTPSTSSTPSTTQSFYAFLALSLLSISSSTIPYILASYRHPEDIARWDNDYDASAVLCTVARRASVAQGRALVRVWERSLRASWQGTRADDTRDGKERSQEELAVQALERFSTSLKAPASEYQEGFAPNGHLAPLWSLVCLSLSIPLQSVAYVFLFNHTRNILSAAVRAGVMGPYQAQGVLGSGWLQESIWSGVKENWNVSVMDAGQAVPVLDLWSGRHECLYSRIFNS
ncbi:MAG: hypothetical protein MMC33_009751 [Icmadophila ericetorum]|nr:hypothetical protein [Icmadophila ericetorum]